MSGRRDSYVDQWLEKGVDFRRRRVRLFGEVDSVLAELAVSSLCLLDQSEGPIQVILSTYGGDVYDGLAIYDAVALCRNHVSVVGTGPVMSMGAFVLQAADERVLTPNSRLMFHRGYWEHGDHPQSFVNWADECKRWMAWEEDLLLRRIKEKHPKTTRKKVQEFIEHDRILTAHEALELGLCDKVEGA